MASVDDLLAECADGDGWAAAAQSAHVAPAPVPTAAPALPFAHCSPPTAPTLLQFNLPRCCAAGGCLRDNSRADERLGALHQPKTCAGRAAYWPRRLGGVLQEPRAAAACGARQPRTKRCAALIKRAACGARAWQHQPRLLPRLPHQLLCTRRHPPVAGEREPSVDLCVVLSLLFMIMHALTVLEWCPGRGWSPDPPTQSPGTRISVGEVHTPTPRALTHLLRESRPTVVKSTG